MGKIYNVIVPYYDRKTNHTKLKARPCMILHEPYGKDHEYAILPISSSLDMAHYDTYFDTYLQVKDFPLLKLHRNSYIRSHKQTIAYETNIDFRRCLGDLKKDYPCTYNIILQKVHEFDNIKINNGR